MFVSLYGMSVHEQQHKYCYECLHLSVTTEAVREITKLLSTVEMHICLKMLQNITAIHITHIYSVYTVNLYGVCT